MVRTMRKLILMLVLIALQGCSEGERFTTNYTVWVNQSRCLEGTESEFASDGFKCKGRTEHAGVLEIKLFPEQRFALVHVVIQDQKNLSADLYKVNECNILDSENWSCFQSYGVDYSVTYDVRNGDYSQISYGIDSNRYAGKIHQGQATEFKRKLFKALQILD